MNGKDGQKEQEERKGQKQSTQRSGQSRVTNQGKQQKRTIEQKMMTQNEAKKQPIGQKGKVETMQSQEKRQKQRPRSYNIQFEFQDLRKMLKLNAPLRSTIKSQRPFFAMKMDYDFAHMDIKATIKQTKQQISTIVPLAEIPYFQQYRETYVILIRIIYQGG